MTRSSARTYTRSEGSNVAASDLNNLERNLLGHWFDFGLTYEIYIDARATDSDPWVTLNLNPSADYIDTVTPASKEPPSVVVMGQRTFEFNPSTSHTRRNFHIDGGYRQYTDADYFGIHIYGHNNRQYVQWPMRMLQDLRFTAHDKLTDYDGSENLVATIQDVTTGNDDFGQRNAIKLTVVKTSLDSIGISVSDMPDGITQSAYRLVAVYSGGGGGGGSGGGSGSGVTTADVQSLIATGVKDYARTGGNTISLGDISPPARLPLTPSSRRFCSVEWFTVAWFRPLQSHRQLTAYIRLARHQRRRTVYR